MWKPIDQLSKRTRLLENFVGQHEHSAGKVYTVSRQMRNGSSYKSCAAPLARERKLERAGVRYLPWPLLHCSSATAIAAPVQEAWGVYMWVPWPLLAPTHRLSDIAILRPL